MPYFRHCTNGCYGIYSKSRVGFAFKNTWMYIKECLGDIPEENCLGNIFDVMATIWGIPIFIFYFVSAETKYKTKSKEFDPTKDLEENL